MDWLRFSNPSQRRTERVGSVAVDSGEIAFVDPAYVREGVAGGGRGATRLRFQKGPARGKDYGVVVPTGWGDGTYPVYVEYEGKMPKRIVVKL